VCSSDLALFTPSTKAPQGDHDLPITRAEMEAAIGAELTARIIAASLAIYARAVEIAAAAGIIIADTKMEFGIVAGKLTLVDELMTPDSSRFWSAKSWQPGRAQESWDKQIVRDYLLTLGWDQTPPGPVLPAAIVEKTAARYQEISEILTR
jgi:phosphoribosylaminoimidazole-succinocarboxamide synthase